MKDPIRQMPFSIRGPKLTAPRLQSAMSIEEVLRHRRSVREFIHEPLELWQISQLLWAAQGITDPDGLRTAPSAGALYPLELYTCAGNVEGLPRGIYRYEPDDHELTVTLQGDARTELCEASLSQTCLMDAAAVFVFSAIYERTTVKYGERGLRYVHIEVGHAAQNLVLQAAALDEFFGPAGFQSILCRRSSTSGLPQCFDLFGHERSWGAAKAYRWGLKGRFNEPGAGLMDDAERLNDAARELYRKEVQGLIDVINKEIGEDQPKLYVPDIKFRRAIGDYKGQRFSVRGKALSEEAYRMHLKEVLPTGTDREKLQRITKGPDWIAPTF